MIVIGRRRYLGGDSGQPVNMNIIKKLNQLIESNESVALVSITKDTGSSPRGIGSMMLVGPEGLIEGSIGGGAVEHHVIKEAIKQLKVGKDLSLFIPLNSLDMTCGGDIEVFIKCFGKKREILIAGAGHICKALIPILKSLDYIIHVIDHRQGIFDEPVFDQVKTYTGDMQESLNTFDFHQDLFVVIVTHGHVYDELTLGHVLRNSHRYVGMIGSQSKIKNCFNNLIQSGIQDETLKEVYAPIGLTLGGQTPEAIALSITAEIQSVAYDKKVDHYKNTKGVL